MILRRRRDGFTLIEALIALAVVGMALLMGVGLVLQERGIEARLAAHREALGLLEASLETLRSGAVPLMPGPMALPVPAPPGMGDAVLLELEVEPLEPAGLYKVTVRARYSVRGQPLRRSLETMVWRQP